MQNQNNQKIIISERNLLRVGLRSKVFAKNGTLAYFGNSYVFEIESVNDSDQKLYNHRNSSYISLNQSFMNYKLEIAGTLCI